VSAFNFLEKLMKCGLKKKRDSFFPLGPIIILENVKKKIIDLNGDFTFRLWGPLARPTPLFKYYYYYSYYDNNTSCFFR